MDISVDPCDNFYQFTCGGWERKVFLNETDNGGIFELISNTTTTEIINFLNSEYMVDESLSQEDQVYDEKVFNQLKGYYDICMNKELNESYPNERAINFVKSLNLTEIKESLKEKDSFTNMIIKLDLSGVDTFIKLQPDLKEEISDKGLITIMGSIEVYLDSVYTMMTTKIPDALSTYKKYIKDMLTSIHGNETNIDSMVDNIYNTELKIAKILNQNHYIDITLLGVDPENYEVYKLNELNEKYPFMNWELYFNKVFEFFHLSEFLSDDLIIYNEIPQIFMGLNDLINEMTADDLANYLEWRVIRKDALTDYYTDDIHEIQIEYDKKMKEYKNGLSSEDINEIYGSELASLVDIEKLITMYGYRVNSFSEEDRSLVCFGYIDYIMPMAITRYFVKRNFEADFKENFKEMIDNIKEAMTNRIPKMEWLDEETKEYAVEKVVKMKDRIGYSDEAMDPKYLYQTYGSLEIDNLFDLILNSDANKYGKYLKFMDPNEWLITPYTVNAYYHPNTNSINFPAAIIQSPFYDSKEQDYINYGSSGSIIGHELTHAFDDSGRLLDIDGHVNNWWTDNDSEEFTEYAQCFIDQYNNFSYNIGDMKVNVNGEVNI